MTGVCYDKKLFEETEKQMISNFFESFGMMEIVPEYMMNAVVCISSSAPAYIYMFIEALADAGVKVRHAVEMVAYRMAGAGRCRQCEDGTRGPASIRAHSKMMFCSPGGTTIYAVMRPGGSMVLRNAVNQGM